jgi:hypothetical protein
MPPLFGSESGGMAAELQIKLADSASDNPEL